MATTAFKGAPCGPWASCPTVGTAAPAVALTGADLSDITLDAYQGRRVVLNIFRPSTPRCAPPASAPSTRRPPRSTTPPSSAPEDLPFARPFLRAEGIENVVVGSAFRTDFGGATCHPARQPAGRRAGSARSSSSTRPDCDPHRLVPEITTEPDYKRPSRPSASQLVPIRSGTPVWVLPDRMHTSWTTAGQCAVAFRGSPARRTAGRSWRTGPGARRPSG